MKLIGITGSCGKTSVAEMVYQYLLYQGNSVSLYSSNGHFINGLTREKDFFQTTLYHKDLDKLLKEDEDNLVDYTIIEITAESVARNDKVHLLPYEIVALTCFFSGLYNHFDNKEQYYSCKRAILTAPQTKKVLMRLEDNNYSMFSDIKHITYGYSEKALHQLNVLGNTIEGLCLSYNGVQFTTNLITAYHARNLACALAILSELQCLDMQSFKEYAKNIFIRGRFEKFICKNKTVVLDTGFAGADMLLLGLERTLENTTGQSHYKVIYSNVHYNNVNDWVKNARKRAGEYIRRGRFIYLTNPTNSKDEEEIFVGDVINDSTFKSYRYLANIQEACSVAINELQSDETLVIITREHYRKYRECLENLNANL